MLSDIFFLIFIFLGHISLNTSQFTNDDQNCDKASNCNVVSYCISQYIYSELDSYVVNNKTLMRTITEAVFVTSKGTSA